jgi:hypothetical protein
MRFFDQKLKLKLDWSLGLSVGVELALLVSVKLEAKEKVQGPRLVARPLNPHPHPL